MKLKKIVDALPSLRKLAAADMPLRRLYQVKKLAAALQPEFDFFDEKRKAIVEKYCDPDNKTEILPENIEKTDVEFKELLDFEVSVKYKAVEIPDSDDIKLSLNDLKALDGFVKILFTEDETT